MGTLCVVDEERVWSAEELERLTPEERQRLLDDRVITDLSQVPAEFLAKVMTDSRALLEERGLIARHPDGG